MVPVSAVSGEQVELLAEVMTRYLPESPQLYPDDMITDEPEQVLIAELIREAALEGVRDELPHSIAVMVEEMERQRPARAGSRRSTPTCTSSGPPRRRSSSVTTGSRLREVGTRARKEIEQLLGTRVYLDLHIRVAKDWQRDPKQLRKLGF